MLNLATPWLLLLIPIPAIIRWYLPVVKKIDALALRIPFFNRLKSIEAPFSIQDFQLFHKRLIIPFIIWCLLCLALSGPEWLGKSIELPQSGRDIMLALDLSGSMQIPDMELNGQYFNRLSVVKIAARKFVQARTGDRLGLILFGTHAYLQTPLTFDQQTILQMLDDATIGLAGPQTAIGDAIGLALKQFAHAPGNSKVLVLLTDGGNNAGMVSPLDAAAIANKMGIKIYTIGIGAQEMTVQGLFGPEIIHPTSPVDEEALQEIAKMTGGKFFRAESGNQLQQVYDAINQLVPVISSSDLFRPIKPLFPWPLGLALFLSLYLALSKLNFSSKNILGRNI